MKSSPLIYGGGGGGGREVETKMPPEMPHNYELQYILSFFLYFYFWIRYFSQATLRLFWFIQYDFSIFFLGRKICKSPMNYFVITADVQQFIRYGINFLSVNCEFCDAKFFYE